jgi:hypothetical protein
MTAMPPTTAPMMVGVVLVVVWPVEVAGDIVALALPTAVAEGKRELTEAELGWIRR